jgi:N-dimethylarginine dimethylaminohydrolase
MQSMHCSKSENSKGGRIDSFIKCSFLPLEIWPNDSAIISKRHYILSRFQLSFVDEETISVSHTFVSHTFTESCTNNL